MSLVENRSLQAERCAMRQGRSVAPAETCGEVYVLLTNWQRGDGKFGKAAADRRNADDRGHTGGEVNYVYKK